MLMTELPSLQVYNQV